MQCRNFVVNPIFIHERAYREFGIVFQGNFPQPVCNFILFIMNVIACRKHYDLVTRTVGGLLDISTRMAKLEKHFTSPW